MHPLPFALNELDRHRAELARTSCKGEHPRIAGAIPTCPDCHDVCESILTLERTIGSEEKAGHKALRCESCGRWEHALEYRGHLRAHLEGREP